MNTVKRPEHDFRFRLVISHAASLQHQVNHDLIRYPHDNVIVQVVREDLADCLVGK